MTDPLVIIEKHPLHNGKSIGIMTLNRPHALNAMTFDMFFIMRDALRDWRDDKDVVGMIFNGAGDRAFCAGGDITSLREQILQGTDDDIALFFRHEYSGQLELRAFAKPTIAYGHGYVMGGGLGVLQATHHRIITQNTIMSMPEVNIGLYPDVGASKFFGGMPLWLSRFMGITGAMLNSADIRDCHLADAVLPDHSFETLLDALAKADLTGNRDTDNITIGNVLADLSTTDLPAGNVMPLWHDIMNLCHQPSLAQAVAKCQSYAQQSDGSPWLQKCIATLLAGCPNSAGLWWIMASEARMMSIEQVLRAEMALSYHMVSQRPDFTEGVRAVLIDKDRNPKWSNNFKTLDMQDLQALWIESTLTDMEFVGANEGWAYEK